MAEYVHHQMEKMVGQFEQMLRVGIFNEKQIKTLVKKRRDFEYKLVQRQKQKRHFMAYINHEICLIEVVKMKRKQVGYFHKSEEIEYQIVKRINRIFDMALNRWPKDLNIWMSQAKFLIKWNMKVLLSKMCSRMLALHGHDTRLWCLTAKWELECGQSDANCRKVFLRALQTHEGSREVMVEYFRAELLLVEKRRLRLLELTNNALQDNKDEKEEEIDDVDQEELDKDKLIMSGELARIVYKNFRQFHPEDCEWTIEFAKVASLFRHAEYGRKIFDEVVSDLKSGEFASKPETCVALARFQLHHSADENGKRDVSGVVESLKREVVRYKSRDMLTAYVTFLTELASNSSDVTKQEGDVITGELRWAAEMCVTSPELLDDDVIAVMCRHLNARASYLLSAATIGSRGESCGELAHIRTVALLGANEKFKVDDFVTSLPVVMTSSRRVRREHCEAMTSWMTCGDDRDVTDEAALKLMDWMKMNNKFDDDLVKMVVVRLLALVFVDRGIGALHKIYKEEVINVINGSESFYVETIKLMKQANEDESEFIDEMGKLHENSLRAHHTTSVQLWIEYLMYASNNIKVDASRLYQRACKSLQPKLVQEFVDRASLL